MNSTKWNNKSYAREIILMIDLGVRMRSQIKEEQQLKICQNNNKSDDEYKQLHKFWLKQPEYEVNKRLCRL